MKKIKMNLFKLISILTLLCFSLLQFPVTIFTQSKIKTIAVLNFENTTKKKKYDYLSATLAESISTFLVKYSNNTIPIVERTQIDKTLKEIGLQQSGFTSKKNAVKVGKLTNATHIIVGSYTIIEDVIKINARLISVETGKAVLAEEVTGKSGEETFNQINKLSAKIIENLTGEKIKIKEFKEVKNPFSLTLTLPRKKNSIIWLTIGIIGVGILIYSLTKSEQKTTVNISQ